MHLCFKSLKFKDVSNREIIESLRHFSSKKVKNLNFVPTYITRATKKQFFAREDKENFKLTRIRRGDFEKIFPKLICHIDKQKQNLKIRYKLSSYSLIILITLLFFSSYFIYQLLYVKYFLGYTNSIVISLTVLYIIFFFVELYLTNQSINKAIYRYVNDEIKYAV